MRKVFESIQSQELDRLDRFSTTVVGDAIGKIREALEPEFGTLRSDEIGFHLSDWVASAAFLVALHLRPEAFTAEQIEEEVRALLIHAPDHLMAAAHLAGYELHDTFDLGLTIARPKDSTS